MIPRWQLSRDGRTQWHFALAVLLLCAACFVSGFSAGCTYGVAKWIVSHLNNTGAYGGAR